MVEENYFRTGSEEGVLGLQSIVQKACFQYKLAVGNKRYAERMLGYYMGRRDQAKYDFNLIKALYENSIAQTKIRGMNNEQL